MRRVNGTSSTGQSSTLIASFNLDLKERVFSAVIWGDGTSIRAFAGEGDISVQRIHIHSLHSIYGVVWKTINDSNICKSQLTS